MIRKGEIKVYLIPKGVNFCARFKADCVSAALFESGEQQKTMAFREFPLNDPSRTLVSLLSR